MKNEVFKQLLDSGEFETMFKENRINELLNSGDLSAKQLEQLVALGKKISKEELQSRQRDLARQPGYKEHVLTPLIKKILAEQKKVRDPKTGRYIKQQSEDTQETPEEIPQPDSEKIADKAENIKKKFKPKSISNIFGRVKPKKLTAVNSGLYSNIVPTENPKLRTGDGAATVATKIYAILKNDLKEKKLRSELAKDFGDKAYDNEKRRHDEIVAAIEKSKTNAPKIPERDPKTGRFKKAEEPGVAPKTKETVVKKVENKPAPKPETSLPPKTAIKEQPVTPSPPSITTTPIKPSIPKIAQTAAKVAVGTGAALTAAQAIGGAESGGNYDVSYGDRFDKKSNKVINTATDSAGKPLNLKTPEEFSGKKLTEMTLEEVKAFGEYRSRNGAGAGAVGKYQFMPSTLFGRKDNKGVFHPGLIQQLNPAVPMSAKFDKTLQDRLQELLHSQDVSTLKKLGVPITPGYEYMAHYIGAGGANAVYRSVQAGENKTVAEVMVESGFKVGNNKELYEIQAKNFEKILQGRLERKGGLASPHSSGADTGKPLNDSSIDNKEMMKLMRQSSNVIINAPTNINATQSSVKQTFIRPTNPDKPAYQVDIY